MHLKDLKRPESSNMLTVLVLIPARSSPRSMEEVSLSCHPRLMKEAKRPMVKRRQG